MKLILLALVIITPVLGEEACDTIIIYGDAIWFNAMGIYRLKPELYNGKVQYQDDKEYFYLRHRDGMWQLIEQVDPSWYFGYTYGNEEFPYQNKNIWTFIDYEWFNDHPNPNFKVACLDVDPRLWVREGVCETHILSEEIVQGKEATAELCLEKCLNNPTCAGFSLSAEGCVPLHQICFTPTFPTTGGITYVLRGVSKVLEGASAEQSSTDLDWNGGASKAVDGIVDGDLVAGRSCSLTLEESAPWWHVNLGQLNLIRGVVITNRRDCCSEKLEGAVVAVTTEKDQAAISQKLNNSDFSGFEICGTVMDVINDTLPYFRRHLIKCNSTLLARSLVIYKTSVDVLSLCEVGVFGDRVEKYVYMDSKKVAKNEAEQICVDFVEGSLVNVDSEETLTSLNSFIEKTKIKNDVWIANSQSPTIDGIGADVHYEDGELIFNAAALTDTATCTSSSSQSNRYSCEEALDNDDTTSWAMAETDSEPWINIKFRYYYKIFRVQLTQRRFSGESFKDVELQFSEGQSFMMTLEHRQGTTDDDMAGHSIDVQHLDGIITNSIKINVLSSYSSKNNGFSDVKVIGVPRAGLKTFVGECQDGVIVDTFENEGVDSCDDICLKRLDCHAYEVTKENGNDTCNLLYNCNSVDSTQVNSTITLLQNITGFYRYPTPSECTYGIYVGFKTDLTLGGCQQFCEKIPECAAFLFSGHCVLLKDRCRPENFISSRYGTHYYERIGGLRTRANETYVGCFQDDKDNPDFVDFFIETKAVNVSYCKSYCEALNFTYASLMYPDECACGNSFGEHGMTNGEKFTAECYLRCAGDTTRDGICGGGASSVYSVQPHTVDCVSVQTYDNLVMKYGALFKTEICDREMYFICQREHDFCDLGPCDNGGTCSNSGNDFSCTCPPQYEGRKCHIEIDECLSSPCLNGATCRDLFGEYACDCAPGFIGIHCETELDECSSLPCWNNATCMDLVNGFQCQCVEGYTGVYCETDADDCLTSLCGPFGQCVDQLNGFSCICNPGFEGLNCETETDECVSSPCLNNGTCEDRLDSYFCNCLIGFYGDHCQLTDDHCLKKNCSGRGVCQNQLLHAICECDSGWTGEECETSVNDCASDPCLNGGSCIDGHNSFTCTCHPAYSGEFCEYYYGNPSAWGKWSEWSKCTVTCGSGLTFRERKCVPENDQLPIEDCGQESKETKLCGVSCPVEGDLNCTAWSAWSKCEGSCTEAEERRTRICEEDVIEPQTRPCKLEGCSKEELSCFKCEAEVKVYDDVTAMCPETEKCSKDSTHCVYEYNFDEMTSVISTRCGHKKECSSVKPGSPCYNLFSLFFLGESASAADVMAALHKTNSTCTICCTTPQCNEGYIPIQDVISSVSHSSIITYRPVMMLVILLICYVF